MAEGGSRASGFSLDPDPSSQSKFCAPQRCLSCFSSEEMTRSEDLPLALLLPPHKIYSGAGLGSAALSHTGLHLLVVAELLPNDAETRGGLNTRRVLPTGTESSRQRPRAAASPQLLWVAETPARLRCRLLPSPGGAGPRAGGLPAGAGAEPREPRCAATCCGSAA